MSGSTAGSRSPSPLPPARPFVGRCHRPGSVRDYSLWSYSLPPVPTERRPRRLVELFCAADAGVPAVLLGLLRKRSVGRRLRWPPPGWIRGRQARGRTNAMSGFLLTIGRRWNCSVRKKFGNGFPRFPTSSQRPSRPCGDGCLITHYPDLLHRSLVAGPRRGRQGSGPVASPAGRRAGCGWKRRSNAAAVAGGDPAPHENPVPTDTWDLGASSASAPSRGASPCTGRGEFAAAAGPAGELYRRAAGLWTPPSTAPAKGLRVVEDYVRLGVLDDRHLTACRSSGTSWAATLARIPPEERLAARETQTDVGTSLTAGL